jgi:hypothetical protein
MSTTPEEEDAASGTNLQKQRRKNEITNKDEIMRTETERLRE